MLLIFKWGFWAYRADDAIYHIMKNWTSLEDDPLLMTMQNNIQFWCNNFLKSKKGSLWRSLFLFIYKIFRSGCKLMIYQKKKESSLHPCQAHVNDKNITITKKTKSLLFGFQTDTMTCVWALIFHKSQGCKSKKYFTASKFSSFSYIMM